MLQISDDAFVVIDVAAITHTLFIAITIATALKKAIAYNFVKGSINIITTVKPVAAFRRSEDDGIGFGDGEQITPASASTTTSTAINTTMATAPISIGTSTTRRRRRYRCSSSC
mmetsp:Transcript_14446/g.21879  ORF Transcript_14446/g.21879 Transcript_14446/m.21879 type:complete len:114 (-) Transcript_14446:146-487(-)